MLVYYSIRYEIFYFNKQLISTLCNTNVVLDLFTILISHLEKCCYHRNTFICFTTWSKFYHLENGNLRYTQKIQNILIRVCNYLIIYEQSEKYEMWILWYQISLPLIIFSYINIKLKHMNKNIHQFHKPSSSSINKFEITFKISSPEFQTCIFAFNLSSFSSCISLMILTRANPSRANTRSFSESRNEGHKSFFPSPTYATLQNETPSANLSDM